MGLLDGILTRLRRLDPSRWLGASFVNRLTREREVLRRRFGLKPDSAPQSAAETGADETAPEFSGDAPLVDGASDRFRRVPFAQRIASTLADRRDPSSIALAICGTWGEGKTSVLNFIAKELAARPNVVTVRFNPWRYEGEADLLASFFKTLMVALKKHDRALGQRVGKLLEGYVGPLLPAAYGEVAKKVGRAMSDETLEDMKDKVGRALSAAGKRIVVILDDIDRLERAEVHAVFRLVKLCSDFKNTSFVLAYDEALVAAAIAERYGSGEGEAGRQFIEKIVQVPLHLPPPDLRNLLDLCLGGVDEALRAADLRITQEEAVSFVTRFRETFGSKMATPRLARRYSNAILFAVPLLRGEVNTVDLLLLEGVRVFYSALYERIRRSPSLFLCNEPGSIDSIVAPAKEKEAHLARLNEALGEMPAEETEAVTKLIQFLFPHVRGLRAGHAHSSGFERRWAAERRLCSEEYFSRYFAYAVPEADVPDAAVRRNRSADHTYPRGGPGGHPASGERHTGGATCRRSDPTTGTCPARRVNGWRSSATGRRAA